MEEEKKRRGRPRKNQEEPLPPESPGKEAAGAPALSEADWERRQWGLAVRLYLACRAHGMKPAIAEARTFVETYRADTGRKEAAS